MSKNDVMKVIVDFDRPRELKFTFSAMQAMVATDDLDIDALDFDALDLEKSKRILFHALQYDARKNNESLTLDKLDDILDEANFMDVVTGLYEAVNLAVTPTKLQKQQQGGSSEGKK